MTVVYFLNAFQVDNQTGKFLLQSYRLYLVITHFPASIYKTTLDGKTNL